MRSQLGSLVLAGLVLVVLLAAAGAWWLLRLGNDTGLEDFGHQAVLPENEAAGLGDEAVARELVERWLGHFVSDAGRAAQLREYRVDRLDVTRESGLLRVAATYRVRPTRWSLDNWLAGSGGTVEDGWIRGKFSRFEVVEAGGAHRLRQVGPGPS